MNKHYEKYLRKTNKPVQEAWEQYQLTLRLVYDRNKEEKFLNDCDTMFDKSFEIIIKGLHADE